jgi:hypothetical protein
MYYYERIIVGERVCFNLLRAYGSIPNQLPCVLSIEAKQNS